MSQPEKKTHRRRTDENLDAPVQISLRQYQYLSKVNRCHERLTYLLGLISGSSLPKGAVPLLAELLDLSHNENVRLDSLEVLGIMARFREAFAANQPPDLHWEIPAESITPGK